MERKTALITGACVNTGYAIAQKFIRENWNVVITGRDQARVDEAVTKLSADKKDGFVMGYAISPTDKNGNVDEQSVEQMFEYLDDKNVSVDALVLNAAHLGVGIKIFESPLSDFVNVLNVNTVWNYCLVEKCAIRMREKGDGSIIFINSNTAYRAIPDRIAYSASKGAQLGMMRALALDLGKYNIRVNAVLPGMIWTTRWDNDYEFYSNIPSAYTPLRDVARGSDIADGVWYFASSARNTTGAELTIDGGNTIQLYPLIPDNKIKQ